MGSKWRIYMIEKKPCMQMWDLEKGSDHLAEVSGIVAEVILENIIGKCIDQEDQKCGESTKKLF